MDPRFPHPRPKGSHHQFPNQRPAHRQGYGPPPPPLPPTQIYNRPNLPNHMQSNNYDENYPQNQQIIVQPQEWPQPQYSSAPREQYVSPTCSSPVANAPQLPTMYASPLPAVYNAQPTQLPDGNILVNSQMYQTYFDFCCAFCKSYNIYWKILSDEKAKIVIEKDAEIAQLSAKLEKLEMEKRNSDQTEQMLKTTERRNSYNSVDFDDRKTLERTVTGSQLSVDAPEFNFSQNNQPLVPVVSANGDSNEVRNYSTEGLRVENSNYTSDENINEGIRFGTENTEEDQIVGSSGVESPDIKSEPTSISNSEPNDLDNNCNFVEVGKEQEQVVCDPPKETLGNEKIESQVENRTTEVETKVDLKKEVNSQVDMDNSSLYNTSHNRHSYKPNPFGKGRPIQNKGKISIKQTEIKPRFCDTQGNSQRKNPEDGVSNYRNRKDKDTRTLVEADSMNVEPVSSVRCDLHTENRDESCNMNVDSEKFNKNKNQERKKIMNNYRGRMEDQSEPGPSSFNADYPPLGLDSSSSIHKRVPQGLETKPSESKRSRSSSLSKAPESGEGAAAASSSNEYTGGNSHSPQEGGSGSGKNRYNDKSRTNYRKNDQDRNQKRQEFLTEVTGDLFSAPEHFSLAHCVGSDFRMGAGIAVTFKQNYKRVGELLDQKCKVGDVAVLKDGSRYIFYIVTKKFSTGKPSYPDFKRSLEDLMAKCVHFEVKHLAIPRIGCGLDKLDWRQVKIMIKEVFDGLNIEITVYNFEDGIQEKDLKDLQQEKDKKGPTKKRSNGPFVQESPKPLVEIATETALIFLGTEDGHMDRTAESLNMKYHFASFYKSVKKTVGEVVRMEKNNEVLFSLIVRKKVDEPLHFVELETCLRKLNKLLTTDQFVYVGFEAFNDPTDDTLMAKIFTMLRTILKSSLELWICWPDYVVNTEKEYRGRPPYY